MATPFRFSTSELRRPRRELQSRGRFTLSPGLGAGIPPLTYACAVGCRPFSAHETQPTGRKPGSGVDAVASTTTLVRASGSNSSANDVDDPVSGDITEGEGLSLARTEPPRVPRSPIHLMCSPHRARRPCPRQGERWSVWEEISKNLRPLSGRTGVPQPGKAICLQGFTDPVRLAPRASSSCSPEPSRSPCLSTGSAGPPEQVGHPG